MRTFTPTRVHWLTLAVGSAAAAAALTSGGPADARPAPVERSSTSKAASQVAKVTEGATATVTFTLPKAVKATTKLAFQTADGTARARADYKPMKGKTKVTARSRTAVVRIPTTADLVHESTETFKVTLRPTSGKAITRTVTILDDDALPTVSVDDAAVAEDAGSLHFAVTLSVPSKQPVSVSYASSTGSGTSGYDFTATSGVLVLPPGSTSSAVDVPVLPDQAIEPDEVMTLTLRTPVNAALGRSEASGTITNDDLPALTLTSGVQRQEGQSGPLDIPVTLDAPAPAPVTFSVMPAAAPADRRIAVGGVDYSVLTPAVRIDAGQTTGHIQVQVTDDAEPEPTEPVELALSNLTGATAASVAASAEILDDADPWVATLTPITTPLAATECSPGEQGLVYRQVEGRVTLNGTPWLTGQATIGLATTAGTATEGSDYVLPESQVVLGAGDATAVVAVNVLCDTLREADETFSLVIAGGTGFEITILNDDGAVVTASRPQRTESDPMATWTLAIAHPEDAPVVIGWQTDATGTATAAQDYVAAQGTCTIPAGSTSCTFSVLLLNDPNLEPTESIAVALSATSDNVLSLPAHAYADISDDDGGPGLGHLVINEVDYDQLGTAADTAEFVEIYNPTSVPVDLSAYRVVAVDGQNDGTPGSVAYAEFPLASAGILPPRSYLVLADTGVAVAPTALTIRMTGADNLQNGSPDAIALLDSSNAVVDALSYEGSVLHASGYGLSNTSLVEGMALNASVQDAGAGDGSLVRYPDGQDADDAGVDWFASDTPTPGMFNMP